MAKMKVKEETDPWEGVEPGFSHRQGSDEEQKPLNFTVRDEDQTVASTSGKKRSMVWDHFDLIPPNKVRCLHCTQVLSHTDNTSSMLRHLRARHNTDQSQQSTTGPVSKKKMLDEAIVDMIIKDGQPFSMVEGEGFTNLMKILDPLYKVPCRKTVKTMVEERYQQNKKKAKEDLKKASAVSLTADMWTSRNMDAYLGVTCHYLSDDIELSTVLLGVQYFPMTHTAAHIAEAASTMMAEWGIADKVCTMVTDGTRNIVASVNSLSIQNIHCFAHLLNLVVKKSISQTCELDTIRSKARKIVGHFKSSWTSKEKLAITQSNMGMPQLKMVQEVETRWNSTFAMFQRMYEQREPLGAALASLTSTSNLTSFSTEDYDAINQCLKVLRPFHQATVELCGETRVSGSKVIPITKMLNHVITVECTQMDDGVGATLATHLKNNITEKMSGLEKITSLSLATLLDPRFKEVAFCSPSNAQAAVERLSRECASLIELRTQGEVQPQPSPASSEDDSLWALLDSHVVAQQTSPASDSATEEIQRYLKEQHLPRCEDPLKYWESHKIQYPNLWRLAQKYLCIPASSVPCERIFSKADHDVSEHPQIKEEQEVCIKQEEEGLSEFPLNIISIKTEDGEDRCFQSSPGEEHNQETNGEDWDESDCYSSDSEDSWDNDDPAEKDWIQKWKVDDDICYPAHVKNNSQNKDSEGTAEELKCPDCGKKFLGKLYLKRHMMRHTGRRPYTCSVCKKGFTQNAHLRKHMQSHTGEKPFNCSMCDATFSLKQNLHRHMTIHSGEKSFSCPVCQKGFTQKCHLVRHMGLHLGEKICSCPEEKCEHTQSLDGQIIALSGEKPFRCPFCSKGFTRKDHLSSHLSTHTGDKQFDCPECDAKFNLKQSLERHMTVHSGEKPFSCPDCKKCFTRNSTLKLHMRTHTGEKPYSCTECKAEFNRKENLIRHMTIHTGARPYSCPVCKRDFTRKPSLDKHMKSHNEQQEVSFDD